MRQSDRKGRTVPSREKQDGEKNRGRPVTPGFYSRIAGFAGRHDTLLLFILLFLIYNTVTGIFVVSGDAAPASFLPVSILKDHTLDFDHYDPPPVSNPDIAYAFPRVNGHYISLFPIVTPVLVTPVYAVSYLLCYLFRISLGFSEFMIIAKTSASIIAALAGVFFYRVSTDLFLKRTALACTGIFAFATSTWSISSQTLWQHGTVELLLIVLVYLIIRNEKTAGTLNVLLLGIISGLFIFNRPPDSILLIPVLAYMLRYRAGQLLPYAAGGILGGLPFLFYNYSVFGSVFGGYSRNLALFEPGPQSVIACAGLLVAPNVGLFVFSPVLVLSIPGFYAVMKSRSSAIRDILLAFGPAIVFQILLYSIFGPWASSAAHCFGPRFLTGFVPILCLYTGFFLEPYLGKPGSEHHVPNRSMVLALVAGLIIVSVCIQFIGAFYYPNYPDKTMSSERAWNANDSIITGSFFYRDGQIPGIYLYTLPPLPPVLEYDLIPATGNR